MTVLESENTLEAFELLHHAGHLYGAAGGIARQLQARGTLSLSPRQIDVIQSVVNEFCGTHTCACCGCRIEEDEVNAWLESKLCGRHWYYRDSDD